MENHNAYIHQLLNYPLSILHELERENEERRDIQPNIGKQSGMLLTWLIRLINAKNVVEFGTCIGFSTIFLAHALRETNGKLTAVEYSEELFSETQKNLQNANLVDRVQLIHGNAAEIIYSLPGPFDLILQDSDKQLYLPMLETCIQKLRPGGILVADDALFPAMDVPEHMKKPIQDYNQAVFQDDRLVSTILPIGDGMMLSFKK